MAPGAGGEAGEGSPTGTVPGLSGAEGGVSALLSSPRWLRQGHGA